MRKISSLKIRLTEPLVWVMISGVLAGFVLVNINGKTREGGVAFLNVDMLYEVKYMSIDKWAFFLYVLRKRLLVIVGLILVSTTYLGVITAYSYAGWIGMSMGTICASAIYHYGIKGVLLFITAMFPHYFFYIPAWILLLQGVREMCFCNFFPAKRKGSYIGGRREEIQYIVVLLLKVLGVVIIGAILESYVNPRALIGLLKIF